MIKKLQAALDRHVEQGLECGCQLVIYKNGELVCDLVSGWLDDEKKNKVDNKTLFPVFSAGKSILTTLVHICVEKGILKYDDAVVKYWKEYGSCGKKDTCVWHFLTHRAAMWDFPKEFEYKYYYDWEKACAALENASLCGKLGGFHEYHAFTYGILLGRLLEKATGKNIRQLLYDFILEPLKIDDFFWGTPGMRPSNLAKIVPFCDADGNAVLNDWLKINEPEYLLDGLNPSVNTICNAQALAGIHASLVGRGFNGIRLLQDSTIENAVRIRRDPAWEVKAEEWDKFGLGYIVSGPVAPWNRFFGQAGACGAEGFADRETLYAVGLTRNQQLPTDPDYPLRNEISRILGIPERVW